MYITVYKAHMMYIPNIKKVNVKVIMPPKEVTVK